MTRIFLALAALSNLSLGIVFVLGWMVVRPGDATGVPLSVHFLGGLAAVTLTLLVHAVVLTYFMGTGRWIEETTQAYALSIDNRRENVRLKYRTLPGLVGAITLLIVTGAFGAAADPGAGLNWPAAGTVHMLLACVSLLVNLAVSGLEYQTIQRNGRLIEQIMDRVRAIRRERGLEEQLPVA
ncbi:MAG: hypothetical protein AB7U20_07005 [Planctomycetaceae bacterium]